MCAEIIFKKESYWLLLDEEKQERAGRQHKISGFKNSGNVFVLKLVMCLAAGGSHLFYYAF